MAARAGRVWLSITGYGRGDAAPGRVAFGDDAAVAAGAAHAVADADGPLFCADAIADPLTGLHAALAAWACWRAGGGALLDVSLCGVTAHALAFAPTGDFEVVGSADAAQVIAAGAEARVAAPTRAPCGKSRTASCKFRAASRRRAKPGRAGRAKTRRPARERTRRRHRGAAERASGADRGAEISGRAPLDVRIARGRIAAIGAGLARERGEPVCEGRGGALLPGLHDHHVHLHALAAAQTSIACGPPAVLNAQAAGRSAAPRGRARGRLAARRGLSRVRGGTARSRSARCVGRSIGRCACSTAAARSGCSTRPVRDLFCDRNGALARRRRARFTRPHHRTAVPRRCLAARATGWRATRPRGDRRYGSPRSA